MSSDTKLPRYRHVGFWFLAFKKTYLSFCRDVDKANPGKKIYEGEMKELWANLLCSLHGQWNLNVSEDKYTDYLVMAILQINDLDRMKQYWDEKADRFNDPFMSNIGGCDPAELAGAIYTPSYEELAGEFEEEEEEF